MTYHSLIFKRLYELNPAPSSKVTILTILTVFFNMIAKILTKMQRFQIRACIYSETRHVGLMQQIKHIINFLWSGTTEISEKWREQ